LTVDYSIVISFRNVVTLKIKLEIEIEFVAGGHK
jgi:hypothetical protein